MLNSVLLRNMGVEGCPNHMLVISGNSQETMPVLQDEWVEHWNRARVAFRTIFMIVPSLLLISSLDSHGSVLSRELRQKCHSRPNTATAYLQTTKDRCDLDRWNVFSAISFSQFLLSSITPSLFILWIFILWESPVSNHMAIWSPVRNKLLLLL